MADLVQETSKAQVPAPEAVSGHAKSAPVTRLKPSRGWVGIDFRELWEYRELLLFLIWRDVQVRYKQTVLGASWAIIQPFVTMVVFSIIFGRLAGMPSGNIPYPLSTFVALVPWTFFANGLTKSSDSLVGSAYLITKVYFPRLLMPLANVMAGLVDFVLAFAVLVLMMVWYGQVPSLNVVFLPLLLLLALMTSLGAGLWLSAMNVQFRDVKYVVPFLVQIWMFLSAVIYTQSSVREKFGETIYAITSLNPMVGVISGFRWALLSNAPAPGIEMLISVPVSVLLLVSGAFYFRRMERTFADVV